MAHGDNRVVSLQFMVVARQDPALVRQEQIRIKNTVESILSRLETTAKKNGSQPEDHSPCDRSQHDGHKGHHIMPLEEFFQVYFYFSRFTFTFTFLGLLLLLFFRVYFSVYFSSFTFTSTGPTCATKWCRRRGQ